MIKDIKEYFRHDYHARNDIKFTQLRMDHGMTGMGIYWCVVEMLYEEGGHIMRSQYDSIAFALRVDKSLVIAVIEQYNLFDITTNADIFSSKKILCRLKERKEKSKKAAISAKKRWKMIAKSGEAKAMRSHSEGNAIIEENRIEEKRIDIINIAVAEAPTITQRATKFYDSLKPHVDEFGKDTVRDFYDYWSEHSENGKKMRFEKEKVFDIKRRLVTWKKRQISSFARPQTVNPYKVQ